MFIELPRPLYWEGSSKKDFQTFPLAVQKHLGMSLFIVQSGRRPAASKPWHGLGPGMFELVDDHRGDTFRAVYLIRIGNGVHVLHAFQKKSKSGVSTPRPDISLIARRLKQVQARYGPHKRQP
ncbi:type II toxin-antitoxin system RelE/ParE family toxin [Achromobacter xylosoxidans]